MPWIKTVGCDCPECGPDACTPGCVCNFSYSNLASASYTDSLDVTGQFIIGQNLNVFINPDVLSSGRLEVSAGSASWDSGCRGPTSSASTTLAVDAGTTAIDITFTYGCDSGATNVNPVTIELYCDGAFP